MALSRKTKKLLKTYASYKSMKFLGGYGVLASVALGAYRWFKSRRTEQPVHA